MTNASLLLALARPLHAVRLERNMVFPTAAFLYFFLPAFLLCYVLLPWRNAVALFFSLLFFSWGEGTYVLLLLAVIGANYMLGIALSNAEDLEVRRRWLFLGVLTNLLVLSYYKYWGFLLSDVLQLQVTHAELPQLPLGISFFIFQSISYLVDVYRREARAADSFFDLALYIAMFPQLIAGPIVRYGSIAEALKSRSISFGDVFYGLRLFALGLAYKVLIANNAAEVADPILEVNAARLPASTAWVGIGAYTLQIFFDFAGYSLMAIGLGRIMGFRFPRNFNYPYVSRSVTEFWRRWHMSLSSWFRDYLYIPLGGNRSGALRTYRNLLIVFFLCGLWHGAAWTFVVWGLFHGAFLVAERSGLKDLIAAMPRLFGHVYLLLVVMLGWVLFRAENMSHAMKYFGAMFAGTDHHENALHAVEVLSNENLTLLLIGLVLSLPFLERTRWRHWDDGDTATIPSRKTVVLDSLLIVILNATCSMYIMSGTYNPFIYFRF